MVGGKLETQDLTCACGKVTIEVAGRPALQLWCHCQDCRKWYQQSPVAMAIFPESAFSLKEGEEHLVSFSLSKPEMSRRFCQSCGHKFGQKHQEAPYYGILASAIPNLDFKPQAHVFCKDTSVDTLQQYKNDGLPKYVEQQPIAGGDGKKVDL